MMPTATISATSTVACRNCGFCQVACPMGVQIPRIFTLMNAYANLESRVHARNEYALRFEMGRASDCIRCGLCDARCPNGIPVSALMQQAADVFE